MSASQQGDADLGQSLDVVDVRDGATGARSQDDPGGDVAVDERLAEPLYHATAAPSFLGAVRGAGAASVRGGTGDAGTRPPGAREVKADSSSSRRPPP